MPSRFLTIGSSNSTDSSSENGNLFTADKKYSIDKIEITHSFTSTYSFSYALWKRPVASMGGDIIDRSSTDSADAAAAFGISDPSKVSITRLMRAGSTSIVDDLKGKGYTLDAGESLYIVTANNIPYGQTARVGCVARITLTPI